MEIRRDEYFGFVRWLNLVIGFFNLYLYVNGLGHHLLAIGMINIALWVFTRKR